MCIRDRFRLDDLARLRDGWQGKLIVKGVVNALDVDAICLLYTSRCV